MSTASPASRRNQRELEAETPSLQTEPTREEWGAIEIQGDWPALANAHPKIAKRVIAIQTSLLLQMKLNLSSEDISLAVDILGIDRTEGEVFRLYLCRSTYDKVRSAEPSQTNLYFCFAPNRDEIRARDSAGVLQCTVTAEDVATFLFLRLRHGIAMFKSLLIRNAFQKNCLRCQETTCRIGEQLK